MGCSKNTALSSQPSGCENQPSIGSRTVPILEQGGCRFRDLNSNGTLDTYEDWRLPVQNRAADLVQRMSLEEKAGLLLHANAYNNTEFPLPATGYNTQQVGGAIQIQHVRYFVSRLALPPAELAAANNELQAIAEKTRLGIPLVISSDARHHFQETAGASVKAAGFTQFPEPLGFAALNATESTLAFADVVRQEYRAVGITQSLAPQADLATEPRWPRINGTFGDQADIAQAMVGAYVDGVQNGRFGLGADSVAAVVKHWVGYGAAKDGLDAHNYYGRFAALTTAQLDNHIKPFLTAFANNVAGVMPAYSIFEGLEVAGEAVPAVAAGYSKPLLDLLPQHQFEGVVLSDWAITNDCEDICKHGFPEGQRPTFEGISTAWGVEDLSAPERFALALEAGIDQFGGVNDVGDLLVAVSEGLVDEARLDRSATKVIQQTMSLGLFENPFVDETAAVQTVGLQASKKLAEQLQAQSSVLLQNNAELLPLNTADGVKLFVIGEIQAEVFEKAGFRLVSNAADADVVLAKLNAPYETLYPNYFFGSVQHDGSLAFDEESLAVLRELPPSTSVITSIYLDRPAILTPLLPLSTSVIANFGLSDESLVALLLGQEKAAGRLPFELPRSMQAVEQQASDTPSDSESPLFEVGFSLPY